MKRNMLLALLGSLLSISICLGQEVTGKIAGRVIDSFGQPILEVNIVIKGANLQGSKGAVTDADGFFQVLALPVGVYTVEISHVAYRDITYSDIKVRLGRTISLGEVTLQAEAVEMEAVIVSEERSLIDPTTTTTDNSLNAEVYEQLPIERNYRYIVNLLPQVNQSYLGDEANISGSTGPENVYYIDGINATDPYQATTSINLPYNFVKEVEVKNGGYEAEHGRALGGIVNVITYSGSNQFNGQVFGFFNNNRLTGEPQRGVIESDEGDFQKYDIGVSLSGPVLRDKLWFFAAYNPNFENEELQVPGFGTQTDQRENHIFAGKLTWQAARNTNIVFNMLGNISKQDRIGRFWSFVPAPNNLETLDPLIGQVKEGGLSFSLNGIQTIGNNFLLEASLSRVERKEDNVPGSDAGGIEPIFIDYTSGITYSGGYGTTQNRLSRRSAAKINGSLLLKSHSIKAGIEYEDNYLDENIFLTDPGIIQRDGFDTYNVIYYDLDFEVRNRVLTLFAQDSWQINNRFRINAGLRLDAQFLIGETGELVQKITDQYQPRIGFVFQPGSPGSQKIYGSVGRFYEQLPTAFAARFGSIRNGIIFYDHDPRFDPSNPLLEIDLSTGALEEVAGLEGQHFDEFSLGYERTISGNNKFGIRGVFRTLRQAIESGYDFENEIFIVGNPGVGKLSYMPQMEREYRALELTFEKSRGKHFNFLTSYVLSRNYGNYEGLYEASSGLGMTRTNSLGYDWPDQQVNIDGLLFNDRTHVFKFSGSYRFDFGLTSGIFFLWQSGTPINELGRSEGLGPRTIFLQPRGSLGRSPSLWDLNLRFSYSFNKLLGSAVKPKLLLDILHLGSQREAVAIDQTRFFGIDENGNQTTPNPNYLEPLAFQPPMTIRLGMEITF